MKLVQQAEAVFRDIEKLYKLLGVYGGDVRQFQRQVDFVDQNFIESLRNPVEPRFAYSFDLLMTVVYFEGQEVFRAEKPEYTLAHALFSEGIKSIVVQTTLRSKELVDWLSTVRRFLIENVDHDSENQSDKSDLASFLWKTESPSIQVELYNNLVSFQGMETMKSDDIDEEVFDEDWEAYKAEFMSTRASSFREDQWARRDEQWSLPSGDLVGDRILPDFDASQVADRLKEELSDMAFSEKAARIIRFSPQELDSLKAELAHFDYNQIDFNLIVQLFISAESQAERGQAPNEFLVQEALSEIQVILNRFHAPLMLYVLKRVAPWKRREPLQAFFEQILSLIREALKKPEMAERIAESFALESRAELASQLLRFSGPEALVVIFQQLSQDKRRAAQVRFLQALIDNGSKLMDFLFQWPAELVVDVLEALPKIKVSDKDEIFLRALRSGSPMVRRKAVERLPFLALDLPSAKTLFAKMPLVEKQEWLQVLTATNPTDEWKPFAQYLLSSSSWRQFPDSLSAAALDFLIYYLGSASIVELKTWVKQRKWGFIPKYASERQKVLEAFMRIKNSRLHTQVRETLEVESRVLFQNPLLKKSIKEHL